MVRCSKSLTVAALVLLAGAALAQEPAPSPAPSPVPEAGSNLLDYLKEHASIVSGLQAADGEQSEFVSLSLDDDFSIAPRWRGVAGLGLFGRARAGESEVAPGIPTSFEELALYSAGEAYAGFYFEWTPKVALECRGGLTFAMTGLTGTQGAPVDGSKLLAACGVRLTGGPGRLSILAGHDGEVDAGADLYGFLPTVVYDGEFRLPKDTSFILTIAAGRDLATNKAVTTSRFAVKKRF